MADQVNPNPGILLYTRIKKSPYYYASRRHGVQLYSVYNHHYHPRLYRDPVEEYWQLLEGVTLWDVGGAERQVEITGPDAFTFTNMLTPRNLHKCAVGQCKYAFITDQHGGIINDPVLIRLEENHFWLSLADSDVLLWCRGVAVNAGLDVHISEPDVGPVQVQGPKSKEVMTDLFGADILDVPYYYMVRRELDGMPLVITRTGYTGELGYEIYLSDASRHGVKLWDALRRIHDDGVSRKLVGVEIGGASLGAYNDGSMPDFFPVRAGGEIVGKVTSACHSPRLDKNIGFAMVSVEHSAEGVALEVERPEETVEAVVVDRVFFKPEHAEE